MASRSKADDVVLYGMNQEQLERYVEGWMRSHSGWDSWNPSQRRRIEGMYGEPMRGDSFSREEPELRAKPWVTPSEAWDTEDQEQQERLAVRTAPAVESCPRCGELSRLYQDRLGVIRTKCCQVGVV